MGAGKSEALRALEEHGAATLSADAVVHDLLGQGEVSALIVERLGPDVAPGGRIDRGAVAEAVFERPEERKWLEGVLWPRVGARIAEWRGELDSRPEPPRAAVVEVPLLFESGLEAAFDHTVAVVAEEGIRRSRAEARGHAGVEARAARQLTQEEKAERAEFTVRNDGSKDDLRQAIAGLLEKMGV